MEKVKFTTAQSTFFSSLQASSSNDPVHLITTEVSETPTPSVASNGAVISTQPTTSKPLTAVTNAGFIAEIFHSIPKGASTVVCSKSGDPTAGGWIPNPGAQVHGCAANTNNYFNCATFKLDADGTLRARKDNAVAYHCLVLDDVGTKIAAEGLGGFKPSWALETSPGNFQVGFILTNPLTDATDVARLQNAIIAAGLSDPGAIGMARWMRLPVGINGKEKYRSTEGKRFQCRLTQWNPEVRYTVEELVAGLKLDMDAVAPPEALTPPSATVTPAHTTAPAKACDSTRLHQLKQLLASIDPDCPRPEWLRILMAVFHETSGSDEGFALVDDWSSRGQKYKGTKDVEVQWRSFKSDVTNPITIGTLIKMAREAGADTSAIMQNGTEQFEPCETVVIQPEPKTTEATTTAVTKRASGTVSPLTRFSLKNSLIDLEKQRVEQRLIFGDIVLLGQASVLYALANVGKTLILLYLIIDAIKNGRIDPAKLYYINMDDNSSGLIDKVRLANEYGFHMLADGHRGFEAKCFRSDILAMIRDNTATGVVVVIDTLKKFVNTMNKEQSAEFTKVVRQFVLKGGTLVALAHANKNPGLDGKIKYTGTTDIVDDFDCAYTLQTISGQLDAGLRVVEFTNIKRRGDVAETAAYSYSTQRGLSYPELLTSVQEVDPEQLEPLKQAAEIESDAPVIAAIEGCIAQGINTKMKMSDAGSKRAAVSTRIALKVIEKYTGEDVSIHRWRYVVRARGAHVYELLERPQAPEVDTVDAPTRLNPLGTLGQNAQTAESQGDSSAPATLTPTVIDLEHDLY